MTRAPVHPAPSLRQCRRHLRTTPASTLACFEGTGDAPSRGLIPNLAGRTGLAGSPGRPMSRLGLLTGSFSIEVPSAGRFWQTGDQTRKQPDEHEVVVLRESGRDQASDILDQRRESRLLVGTGGCQP